MHPGAAAQDGISAEDYREIGVITNTPAMTVNNGVLVTLTGDSQWTVTGTCYLTKLALSAESMVVPAADLHGHDQAGYLPKLRSLKVAA